MTQTHRLDISTFQTPLDFDGFNEADVRGEIIDPFLRELGYKAGTTDNIVREHSFRYERQFLGRKGKSDRPLEGKPDYVLEVGTSGRWLLEAKAPNVALGVDEFEQAQSYALHPNVAASLFVLTNGREFLFFQANARSISDTLLSFKYEQAHALWPQIFGMLSPAGFTRNVPRIAFDPRRPVAQGYGACVRFSQGVATPTEIRTSVPLPDEAMRMLATLQTPIPAVVCERGDDGRLVMRAKFGSASSHVDEMLRRKGLEYIPIYANDEDISLDRNNPTLFFGEFLFAGKQREMFFDFSTWRPAPLAISVDCYCRIDALGSLADDELNGSYSLRMYMKVMGFDVEAEQLGIFRLSVN